MNVDRRGAGGVTNECLEHRPAGDNQVAAELLEQVGAAAVAGARAVEQAAAVDAFSAETEARQLLELMGAAGVLPVETVTELLKDAKELGPAAESKEEIIEAELVEEDE